MEIFSVFCFFRSVLCVPAHFFYCVFFSSCFSLSILNLSSSFTFAIERACSPSLRLCVCACACVSTLVFHCRRLLLFEIRNILAVFRMCIRAWTHLRAWHHPTICQHIVDPFALNDSTPVAIVVQLKWKRRDENPKEKGKKCRIFSFNFLWWNFLQSESANPLSHHLSNENHTIKKTKERLADGDTSWW